MRKVYKEGSEDEEELAETLVYEEAAEESEEEFTKDNSASGFIGEGPFDADYDNEESFDADYDEEESFSADADDAEYSGENSFGAGTGDADADFEARVKKRKARVRNRKRRRKVLGVIIIIAAFATLATMCGRDIVRLKAENIALQKQQKELEEQRDRLREEVKNSGKREYVQEQARKQLRLLNPGELLFTFEEEDSKENGKD